MPTHQRTRNDHRDTFPEGLVEFGTDPETGKEARQHRRKVRSNRQHRDVPVDHPMGPSGIRTAHGDTAEDDAEDAFHRDFRFATHAHRPHPGKKHQVDHKNHRATVLTMRPGARHAAVSSGGNRST